jgi:hypothetical protein
VLTRVPLNEKKQQVWIVVEKKKEERNREGGRRAREGWSRRTRQDLFVNVRE